MCSVRKCPKKMVGFISKFFPDLIDGIKSQGEKKCGVCRKHKEETAY